MSDKINIVIDTIGGDNGAYVCVKGALQGIKNHKDVKIFLTGHKSEIDLILGECEYNKDQIEVIDCSEEVSLNEPPVQAVREKKDSSLVVGLTLLKKGEADAFISAGSTGAICRKHNTWRSISAKLISIRAINRCQKPTGTKLILNTL